MLNVDNPLKRAISTPLVQSLTIAVDSQTPMMASGTGIFQDVPSV